MGVMSCNRKSCDHIMCDAYISGVGYICFECLDEFKKYIEDMNITRTSKTKFRELLNNFMATEKNDTKIMDIDEFLNGNI